MHEIFWFIQISRKVRSYFTIKFFYCIVTPLYSYVWMKHIKQKVIIPYWKYTHEQNYIMICISKALLGYGVHLLVTIQKISLNNLKISNSKQNKISYYFNFGSRILKILHSQLRLIQCTQTFYVSKKPLWRKNMV